ncbi:MAG: hypothetical protein RR090_11760 [Niameybacter sp.]|uniref:DUF1659 domain-containing protein n=1 Tax=Niameybacter sp. TaxID=2033640 RepID=UPI002FCAAAD6
MAVTAELEEVKVSLKFTKGSQTLGNCYKEATDEGLYNLGQAIGGLHKETLETITKVVESKLIG